MFSEKYEDKCFQKKNEIDLSERSCLFSSLLLLYSSHYYTIIMINVLFVIFNILYFFVWFGSRNLQTILWRTNCEI